MNYAKIYNLLIQFIRQQAQDKNIILGLSGGIDSALVLKLCVDALEDKNRVFALLMPTKQSKQENINDALMLCENLEIKYKIIYIDEILNAFIQQSQKIDKIRIGNFAARTRMCLLYDYSAFYNALVIGTSNKSELMLGYGTIYGDLACAFNPLSELYKSEIFEFAKFLNLHENFIKKAPSADLWINQSDEQDLGFAYKEIDEVLKAIEEEKELKNFDQKLVTMVQNRIQKNAFKRKLPTKLDDLRKLI